MLSTLSSSSTYPFIIRMCDCWVVLSPQSAALQKKLRHLEVQLNNEKQVKVDIEHKYGYRSWRTSCLFSFCSSVNPEDCRRSCPDSFICSGVFSLQSCLQPSRQTFQRAWRRGELISLSLTYFASVFFNVCWCSDPVSPLRLNKSPISHAFRFPPKNYK